MPGQSGSNLLLFSFPHIHSAATFCLKATLSHEHSLRPLLSDERGENRGGGGGGRGWEVRWGEEGEVGGRVTVVIKARYYRGKKATRADGWRRSWDDGGKVKHVTTVWSGQKRKKGREQKNKQTQNQNKSCQNDERATAGAEIRSLHFITTHLPQRAALIWFHLFYMSPPPLPAATAVCCLKQSGKSKRKSSAAPSGRRKIRFFLGDNIGSIIHIFEEVWWESDPKWKKWAQHKETQTTFSNWWKK